MSLNFHVVEGEDENYWAKYEQFIKLWNNGRITVKKIKSKLDLSQSKYKQYRDRALEENRLDIDIRSPRQSVKRGHHTRTSITRSRRK